MLTEPTSEKLQAMRLETMATTWRDQTGKPDVHKLAFDERFGMLVDAEWLYRENKRLATALRDAKLRISSACIEDIEYSTKRELDRAQVRQLGTCRWVIEHQNVLITGATGTGKTYLACALAQQACRKGHRALYRRAARLYSELALARADGTYARVLAKIARADVLVIDDFAMTPITDAERRDLFEVLDDRHGNRSTIISSQIPPKRFHEYIAEPTHADAICDRLIHTAHKLVLKGPSRRDPREESEK
ncbi:MAG TPA: IS21-like element helper ATPase IstB [Kofleriaceae bacterium]|jgi:DNA replication protein DnaC